MLGDPRVSVAHYMMLLEATKTPDNFQGGLEHGGHLYKISEETSCALQRGKRQIPLMIILQADCANVHGLLNVSTSAYGARATRTHVFDITLAKLI